MATRNNKALFFINSLKAGGAETVVRTLAKELNNQGIKSVFVTLYPTDVKFGYIEEFCLDIKKPSNSFQSVKNMLGIGKIMNKNKTWHDFLKKYMIEDFKLITAHLPLSHKVCGYSPWGNDAIYVMHSSQHMVPPAFRQMHGKIIRNFYNGKKVSCVSKGVRDEFINQYNFNPQTTKAIYNPLKIVSAKKKKMHDRPYILMVGRLCKEKRQDIAIEVFKKGNFGKTHDLIILGEGPWREKLEKLADEHIFLPGFVDNVNEWLAGATMLLSTSATEGLPINLIEALQLKVPVVASDCDFGPREILTGKLSEYLGVTVENIQKVLDGKYPEITDKYIKKFMPEKIVNKYIKYYDGSKKPSKTTIPKIIHYCWFGNKPLPKKAKKCIASWKKYFPDYEIKQWDEANYDVNSIPYTEQAYKAKKYAFVSDYARFDILYKYGGFYFDTDVEVIKSFDDILKKGAFMGCESKPSKKGENGLSYDIDINVNPGLGLFAYPKMEFYKEVIEHYKQSNFINEDGSYNLYTVVSRITDLLNKYGLKNKYCIQKIKDIYIYPSEYFNPKSLYTGVVKTTENTHSIHWYDASWMSGKKKTINNILLVTRRVFGVGIFNKVSQNKLISKVWKNKI